MPQPNNPRTRVIVGVDTQFVFHTMRRLYEDDTRFPYTQFLEMLEEQNFDVLEIFATVIRFPPKPGEDPGAAYSAFLRVMHALQEQGVNAIECPARKLSVDSDDVKHSDDQRLMVKLAVACTQLKPDLLILVAADGDYAPLVWALRELGIRTRLISDKGALAPELRRAVNVTTELTRLLDDLPPDERHGG